MSARLARAGRRPTAACREALRLIAGRLRGAFAFTSFRWRECQDYVADALGLGRDHWRDGPREPDPIEATQRRAAIRSAEEQAQADSARRTRRARALWQQALDPRRTVVETYLASCALGLPDEVAGEALRFHPNCPSGEERLPAMFAAMRAIEGNALQRCIARR